MNIDNITSDSMSLTYNGKEMLIKVYEQEIERLYNIINEFEEWLEVNLANLEIERLNNIINEYDKWLENEIQRLEKIQSPKRGVKPYGQEYNNITLLIGAYDNALDKLQELKGVDKE